MILLATALGATPLPDCSTSTEPDQVEASERLKVLYEQAASSSGSAASRLKEVAKLKKRICTAADHAHAGWILLGSEKPKDLEWAYELAQMAAYHHAPKAQLLATTAYDRWQMSLHAPQRYGTQTSPDGTCFWPVEPGFSDDQRAAWGARPIADSIGAFLKTVGRDGEPATEATLLRYQLLCPLE